MIFIILTPKLKSPQRQAFEDYKPPTREIWAASVGFNMR